LHLVVDDKGIVRLPTVDESASPAFAKAAIEAVNKWTFEPAKFDGQPVAVLVRVELQFMCPMGCLF
jgi:outer membrane biosynthesis protein TonB